MTTEELKSYLVYEAEYEAYLVKAMTNQKLQKKFPTVKAINEELKRIAPRKKDHRIWSQLGYVKSREIYYNILRYEKQLKSIKEQLKNNK